MKTKPGVYTLVNVAMTNLQMIMTVVSHSPGGDKPHLQILQLAQHGNVGQVA